MNFFQLRSFLSLILFLCIFTVSSSEAAVNVASVIKMKGKATMLPPGHKEATVIKKGTKLPKDTSIVTKEKSFVIVRFDTGANLTVGPKSKIVIEDVTKKRQGIVNLLNGKLKTIVTKDKKPTAKNKFFIKTRTAAMGVRGTSFQTTYNAKNKVTSLVTFEGKVAMAKIKPETKPVAVAKAKEVKVLEKALEDKKETIVVKKGRYAGVSTNLKKPTRPVKISPKQFTLMKINKTFTEEKKVSKKVLEKEIKKTEKEFAKLAKEEAKEAKKQGKEVKEEEGKYDKKKEEYTPRSGGYVDLDSGIYVPPPKDSKFDEKLKIFKVSEDMGTVKEDGSYQPPKGIKLDAEKGFVIDKNVKNGNGEKVAKLEKLNQGIAGQIVKPKAPSKSDLDELEDDAYEKYFNIQ